MARWRRKGTGCTEPSKKSKGPNLKGQGCNTAGAGTNIVTLMKTFACRFQNKAGGVVQYVF